METLVIVVGVVFIAWFVGLFGTARKGVNMANREVSLLDARHKLRVIETLESMEIDANKAKTAKQKLALLDTIEL